jgi:hypothetical protein
MQSDTPDGLIQIQIPVTLEDAIKTIASADGQSVNTWMVSLLENAVAQSAHVPQDSSPFAAGQAKRHTRPEGA